MDNLISNLSNPIFRRQGDVLLVVPPFAGIDRPSLGVHILQSCAERLGYTVNILYANLLYASLIGVKQYNSICYAPHAKMLGERIFASLIFNTGLFEKKYIDSLNKECQYWKEQSGSKYKFSEENIEACIEKAEKCIDLVAKLIVDGNYCIVGATTTFDQTSSSLAILDKVKQLNPNLITILGGGNCEGEMSFGLLELTTKCLGNRLDFIFSGESEISFTRFLTDYLKRKKLPSNQIIKGLKAQDINKIPTTNFVEYYDQIKSLHPGFDSQQLWIPYETSRGCWWGEKHHCTFCGLNGESMKFREKTPMKVKEELKELISKHPSKKICMVDNIMPHTFFKTLLPSLRQEIPGLQIFYEQKANLNLEKIRLLKESGVFMIQPGIEALSTEFLRLMDKGVTAKQNINLLRYAKSFEMNIVWHLLYGFPNDKAKFYNQTIKLLPLVFHLPPPSGVFPLSIDRFSPYFNTPEKYGISNVKPIELYYQVFPNKVNIHNLAYRFSGKYKSESREHFNLITNLKQLVKKWEEKWNSPRKPSLCITKISDDNFVLTDTRGLNATEDIKFINYKQASISLTGKFKNDPKLINWALENKVGVILENRYTPLAVAEPRLLEIFEESTRNKEKKGLLRPVR